jgi:spermidine/putrescine transport system permease protein
VLPNRTRVNRLALGAWTALVLAFLYVPIVLLIAYSFNASKLNVLWGGFTLRWYADVFRDRPLVDSLVNSLIVAAFTTAIAVPLGTVAAWALYRYRPRFGRSIQTLAMTPIVMPEVIMGVSLLIFFATIAGAGNALLANLGAGSDVLGFGYFTIILGHVTFCFPFVMVTVRARLAGLTRRSRKRQWTLAPGRPARSSPCSCRTSCPRSSPAR